jgi:hypothetical protein
MRPGILAWTVAALALAASAEAQDVWVGPQLGFPVPARDVGDQQLGVGAGVTFTVMNNSHVGYGVDLLYHYWPASPGYKAAFDRYLRRTRFETIDSETWALSAFQATVHVKLVAPRRGRISPWAQVGGGLYFLDRHLEMASREGVYAWVEGTDDVGTGVVPGWYTSVGFDYRACSGVAVGLDVGYHDVFSEYEGHSWSVDKHIPGFSAFTLGTHVLFGW